MAYSLSRLHEPLDSIDTATAVVSCFPLLSHPDSDWVCILRHENIILHGLINFHEQAASGSLAPAYSVKNGFLFYEDRYYIAPQSVLKSVLLQKFHSTPRWATLELNEH